MTHVVMVFCAWIFVSGVFGIGFCVGATMGFKAGAESANEIAESRKPLLDRY